MFFVSLYAATALAISSPKTVPLRLETVSSRSFATRAFRITSLCLINSSACKLMCGSISSCDLPRTLPFRINFKFHVMNFRKYASNTVELAVFAIE